MSNIRPKALVSRNSAPANAPITSPSDMRERRRGAFDTAGAELRRLIREGFELGIPGEQLADEAGLSVPHVYQIRDARR